MKIKMIDLWMQIEVRKLIFIMNFSVLDFFEFASRMPQTAQILVLTFKILRGEGGECPRTLLDISSFFFLFFFLSNSQDLGTKIPILLNFDTERLSFGCCW